jgi:hypothetical protein
MHINQEDPRPHRPEVTGNTAASQNRETLVIFPLDGVLRYNVACYSGQLSQATQLLVLPPQLDVVSAIR